MRRFYSTLARKNTAPLRDKILNSRGLYSKSLQMIKFPFLVLLESVIGKDPHFVRKRRGHIIAGDLRLITCVRLITYIIF